MRKKVHERRENCLKVIDNVEDFERWITLGIRLMPSGIHHMVKNHNLRGVIIDIFNLARTRPHTYSQCIYSSLSMFPVFRALCEIFKY